MNIYNHDIQLSHNFLLLNICLFKYLTLYFIYYLSAENSNIVYDKIFPQKSRIVYTQLFLDKIQKYYSHPQ